MASYKNIRSGLGYTEWKREFLNSDEVVANPSLQGNLNTYWSGYSAKEPKSGGDDGKGANVFQKVAGTGLSLTADLLKTQESQGYMPSMTEEWIKGSTILEEMVDSQGNMLGMTDLLKKSANAAWGQLGLYFKQQTELLGVVNRGIGLTGEYSKDVREELTAANPELLRMGIGFDELARSAETLVDNSGRFITLNRESWKEAGTAATAYVGTLSELVSMFPAFEKIGIGAANVSEQIKIVGQKSLELGLQSEKTVKDLGQNLEKLNEYGFKNGVQGMAEMVRKSTEFRMNMQSVYSIADKVFNPEGAIEVAANLQAIGGAIGDFNDPLKLMYMATNNVEGLQDALIGVAGSLATYNEEQGRFEITGVNLRKAKELATQMGVSYQDLANGAIAAAERSSAATSLLASGLDLDDDQQRFLTNISTMKDGQMTIQLNSDRLKQVFGASEIALENLTDAQAKELMKYQDEFKKLSPEEIVRNQATNVEKMTRDVNYIAALMRNEAGKVGNALADEMGFTQFTNKVSNLATDTSGLVKGAMDDYINKLRTKTVEEKNKESSKPTSQGTNNNNTVNGTITHVHTSDSVVDPIRRSIMQDPEMANRYQVVQDNTYLAPPIAPNIGGYAG